MMNQINTLKTLALISTVALLSSCGNTKSANTASYNYDYSSQAPVLASCNKSVTTDGSYNLAALTNQVGQNDSNWIKLKFNFLSSAVTSQAQTIRIFKWKMVNGQSYLDQTALSSYTYDLSTNATSQTATNTIAVSSVSKSKGYLVNLNDSTGSYQVLKIAAYAANGSIVWQSDALIPQFAANPQQYTINNDGTPRSQVLQALHPLAQTATTSWSTTQFASHFQAFCF